MTYGYGSPFASRSRGRELGVAGGDVLDDVADGRALRLVDGLAAGGLASTVGSSR